MKSVTLLFVLLLCGLVSTAQVVMPTGSQNRLSGTVYVTDSFTNEGTLHLEDSAHFHFSGDHWWQRQRYGTTGRGTVYLIGSRMQTLHNPVQLFKVVVDNNNGVHANLLGIDSAIYLQRGSLQTADLLMQQNSWIVRTGGSLQQRPVAVGAFNLWYPTYAPITAGPELLSKGIKDIVVDNIQGVTVKTDISAQGSVNGIGTIIFNSTQKQTLYAGAGFDIGQLFVQNSAGVALASSGTVRNMLRLDGGKLYLGNDTLTLLADAGIAGNSVKSYIVAGTDAARLIRTGFTGTELFPIGTAEEYLPVSVTQPAAADFAVGVFRGITANAKANGIAATGKDAMVDAVWLLNGSRPGATVSLQWAESLEGTRFKSLEDEQVGLYAYSGSSWQVQTLPQAVSNKTNLIRFVHKGTAERFNIGMKDRSALRLQIALEGRKLFDREGILLQWQVKQVPGLKGRMVLQHSQNGTDFDGIYRVAAIGLPYYHHVHGLAPKGMQYYRVVCYLEGGGEVYSNTVAVSNTSGFEKAEAYPNPTTGPVTVRFTSGNAGPADLLVLNLAGRVMRQTQIELFNGVTEIKMDLNRLPNGIYLIKLRNSVIKVEKMD